MSDQPQTLPPLPFVCPLCLWSWASEGAMRAHIPASHNTTLDRFDAVMEEPTNAINYHVGVNERLTAEVERLTRERDNARAWSARWKAVAKRIWTGVHHPLDMCEFEARRREAAEAERAALAAQVAALREALGGIERKADAARLGLDRNGPQHARITEARDMARAALAAAGGAAQDAGGEGMG